MADLVRDVRKAKQAYIRGDAIASISAHQRGSAPASYGSILRRAPEKHGNAGTWIKGIIFGGLDGLLQSFAVISSVSGGNLSLKVALFLGLATAIADALSMGFGDYLGTKSEVDFSREQRRRETWECENYLEGEKREMIDIYKGKGLSDEEARTIVDIFGKDTKMFVDLMMVDELGLMPNEDESPVKNGLVTFFSFLVCACIPLVTYIISKRFIVGTHPVTTSSGHPIDVAFFIVLGVTILALFLLGLVKGRITHMNPIKSGFLVVMTGVLAGGVSYGIGALVAAVGKGAFSNV